MARELMLRDDIDESHRQVVREALSHIKECASCRLVIQEYEHIRSIMAPPDVEVEPNGGWMAYEEGLRRILDQPRNNGNDSTECQGSH